MKLTSLLQESITVLKDIVDQSKPFFESSQIEQDAMQFLKKDEVKMSIKHITEYLNSKNPEINQNSAKEVLSNIAKEHNIKKGLVMRSLRVALFGSLNGPDLILSWELFALNGEDKKRVKKCLEMI